MTEDPDEMTTTTATPKTRKPKADEATNTGDATERLVLAAANARRSLRTPKGTELRLDLLGETMEQHPETSASTSEPCPKCRHSRGVKLQLTAHLKPDCLVGWHDKTYEGEYTYSPSGLSQTPRVERVKSYRITGFSRKYIQSCTCGAPMGCTWHYAPECHDLTLVQVYHRF